MTMRPRLGRRLALLGGSVALAVVSQLVGENFPLSSWPMYEAPGRHRGVIVVVDGHEFGADRGR
jgi:hypothetical protein